MYRNLTRGRKPYELLPPEAATVIIDHFGNLLEIVDLDKKDHEAAIRRCVQLDLVNSIIYDALHVQAAIKSEADVLYSNNVKDFQRLITADLQLELREIR